MYMSVRDHNPKREEQVLNQCDVEISFNKRSKYGQISIYKYVYIMYKVKDRKISKIVLTEE